MNLPNSDSINNWIMRIVTQNKFGKIFLIKQNFIDWQYKY